MQSSHWARYCGETEGAETLENEMGFCTFLTFSDHIFIKDCYVLPMFRRQGAGSCFVGQIEELARARGKTHVLTSVFVSSNTSALSLAAQIAYGFVPFLADSGKIWLRKQVANAPEAEQVTED